jgi:hypothetical protein
MPSSKRASLAKRDPLALARPRPAAPGNAFFLWHSEKRRVADERTLFAAHLLSEDAIQARYENDEKCHAECVEL